MGLKWSKVGKTEKLFYIPHQIVDVFNLEEQEDLEKFITIYKELLRW